MQPSILLGGSGGPVREPAAARARRPFLVSRRVKQRRRQPATGDEAVNSEQRAAGAIPPASVPRSRELALPWAPPSLASGAELPAGRGQL